VKNLSSPEYSTDHPVVARSLAVPRFAQGGDPGVPVDVMLLGVRVTAYAVIDVAEHRRREAAGVGAVVSPALLDRLMDLPADIAVRDPVAWAEMANQPPGVAERDVNGACITRRLKSPLAITNVVVNAAAGKDKELRAVQDASLFAGFTRRWVAAARSRVPDAAMLEAKLCGVGIIDAHGEVQLQAEKPVSVTRDGWSWLLEEKTYWRWLTQQPENRGKESRVPATDEARGAQPR
jgi:hypothetical protein